MLALCRCSHVTHMQAHPQSDAVLLLVYSADYIVEWGTCVPTPVTC